MGTLDLSTRVISTSPYSLCIGRSVELQNPRIREPGNPGTRKPKNPELGNSESGNPGTGNPGIRERKRGYRNMEMREPETWVREPGYPNLRYQNMGIGNTATRTWSTGNLENREPGNVGT